MLEHPPPNTDRDSPAVSQIQPTREQYPNKDLIAPTIFEAPPPSGFQIRPGMYELTTPNASSGPPKVMPHVNYNADLYGKITHPVEKLLAEIPYTDGLNVTKLLNFIKYLLQIKDLQQLNDWQILQVLLPKCIPPLKNRVLESLLSLIHI